MTDTACASPSATLSATASSTARLTPDQIAHYRTHGWCIVRGLFSAEEAQAMATIDVDRLRRWAAETPSVAHRLQVRTLPTGEVTVQKIEGLRDADPELGRWCSDARLLDMASVLMEEPACLFKDKYILKPRGGGGFGPHQDMAYGFHRFVSGVVSMMIAVDPADAENGCLQVASIAHAPALVSRPEMSLDLRQIPENAWVPVPLQPGDVAIFDGLTPHRSAPNESDRLRRVYIGTYSPAAEGDCYHDYYEWYFSWSRHQAAGGQRTDYPGEPPRRSRPRIRSFTMHEDAAKDIARY